MRYRSPGFTLIELLVVITIIAVLAGLLFPAVGLVRDQAKTLTCRNAQRQIFLASQAYAGDDDGRLPDVELAGGKHWHVLLTDYLEQARTTALSTAVASGNIFQACPMIDRSATGSGYALNNKLAYGDNNLRHNRWVTTPTTHWTPFTTASISRSAQRLYLGDAMAPASPGGAMQNYYNADAVASDLPRALRHRGRIPGLFLDGHGATLDLAGFTRGLQGGE